MWISPRLPPSLKEQHRQREDKFADSWFQESNKEDILAKKFEEANEKSQGRPGRQAHPRFRFGLACKPPARAILS